MANRPVRTAGAVSLKGLSAPTTIVDAGLDALDFGIAIFDRNLKLVTSNRAFAELRGYPVTLCKPGTDIIEFYRFNAERGDYGPGDAEAQAMSRMERVRERQPHELEYELANGQILNIRYTPILGGGLVLSYSDITERKRAERERRAQGGAVACRARQHAGRARLYRRRSEYRLLQRPLRRDVSGAARIVSSQGGHIPISCATWPSTATTARATSTRWLARRVDSLRNPIGYPFEDRTPDGRVYEVNRRRAAQAAR